MCREVVVWDEAVTLETAEYINQRMYVTMVLSDRDVEYTEVMVNDRFRFYALTKEKKAHPVCRETYLVNGLIRDPEKGVITVSLEKMNYNA